MNHYGIICMGMIFLFNNHSSIFKLNKKHYVPLNKLNNKPSLKQYPKNISSTYK
jgi:hypothetical protein